MTQTCGTDLARARAWLTSQRQETWPLPDLFDQLCSVANIFRRTPHTEHRETIAIFHDIAGRFPYFFDRDLGAVVLESVADSEENEQLRAFLYTEALFRARWCAAAASAGGEGLARSRHVAELQGKLAHAA